MIGTILAVALGALVLAIPLLSGLLVHVLPASVSRDVGESTMEGLAGQSSFCRTPEGLAALDRLADTLTKVVDAPHPFEIHVSAEPVLNAFATPGGYVILFRPIIEQAESPDEVAGVLAHEMAHVVESHPDEALVEAIGYGIIGLALPGDESIGSEVGLQVLSSAYSREDELEADRVGIDMLNAAGIRSAGLIEFFERMEQQGSDIPGALELLSTHPTSEKRIAQARSLVSDGRPSMSDEDWQALRNICETTGPPAPVSASD